MAIENKGSLATTVTVSRLPDASGNWVCDGTADDVQINEALGYINSLGRGGRVMLLEGTFTLADPIVFPGNNIWLRGMGRSTIINGNGLANTEHAISLTGRTGCAIKKLAIEISTAVGTRHCIFVDDGCDNLSIHDVTIIDSDSDGVHIEGTTHNDIHIRGLRVDDVDDNGILVAMDGANYCIRLLIDGCLINSAGVMGIHLSDCRYTEVVSNAVTTSTQSGIVIDDACLYVNVSNCMSVLNTQHGILITTTAANCSIEGCIASLNVRHGIYLNGVTDSLVSGCLCAGNDSGDTSTYDGIYLDGTSTDNNITGNHCCLNDRYGIGISGVRNHVQGNFSHENGYHGIWVDDSECAITSNYCTDNSQETVGTYHGINLTANADNCLVEGNFLYSGPDHDRQEDGISLESGAAHCSIVGNLCYYLQGDGIKLAGSNTATVISGNLCYMGSENGIVVTDSTDCNITGNHCMSHTHHGIYLDNADRTNVTGNTCIDNDRLNAGSYDGIVVDSDCIECNVSSNYCYANHRYGISVLGGSRHSITDNHCNVNDQHGISNAGSDTMIQNNWCFDNGQDTPGTYFGIYLTADADRCQINGNHIDGNADATGDCINLASGADQCQINDNYCYNAYGGGASVGNGITLTDCDNCTLENNFCSTNDGYGIAVTAGSKNLVQGNQLLSNVTGAITDGGTLTQVFDDNEGIEITDVKIYRNVKNTSGGALAIGDVVRLKAIAAGNEVTTTAVLADDYVYGMSAEAPANNAWGYVQVKGKTTVLKSSNDHGAIAVGDALCTNDTVVESCKAAPGQTVFAIALETCDAANCTVDAYIKSPWD